MIATKNTRLWHKDITQRRSCVGPAVNGAVFGNTIECEWRKLKTDCACIIKN